MNGENFEHWMSTQLLPNLDEPSVIVMYNASYHNVLDFVMRGLFSLSLCTLVVSFTPTVVLVFGRLSLLSSPMLYFNSFLEV
jgi:hypothetical protein